MSQKVSAVVLFVIAAVLAYFVLAPVDQEKRFAELQSQIRVVDERDPELLIWKEADALIPWEARDSQTTYIFDDKLWFLGGLQAHTSPGGVTNYEDAQYFNDIWYTKNGETWVQAREHADFPPIRSASVVEWNGVLYMYGGWSPVTEYETGIWLSRDGSSWEKVRSQTPWPMREGQKILPYKGKLLMIGGVNYFSRQTFNDVWYSDDALNWYQASAQNGWAPRWDFDVAEYNGKLWLAGGMGLGLMGYGDVWSSADGVSWDLVEQEAEFGKRQGQGMLVYDDTLWLVGGLDAKTDAGVGDAWFTHDGISWTRTQALGGWTGREDHGVVEFKDRIYVIGGMDSRVTWQNDVWYSIFPNTIEFRESVQ